MVRRITFLNRTILRKIQDIVKGNGNKTTTFGLTSLLQTPNNNKLKKIFFSSNGKIITLTTLIITGGGILIYIKYNPDSGTVVLKHDSFIDTIRKTVFREKPPPSDTGIKSTIVGFLYRNKSAPSKQEGFGNLVSSTYNSVKSPIVNLFSGNQTSKQTVTQIDKSNESYISSALSILRTVKDGTGKVLYYSYDCIKSPIDRLISVNKTQPDEVRKQTVFHSFVNLFSAFRTKSDENSQESEFTEFENNPAGSRWSFRDVTNYLNNELQKIKVIIQNFNETSSKEEKCRMLLSWLNEINNIYYTMQSLSTNAPSTILSQYSTYSKNMSRWIVQLSKDDEFKTVVTVLSCATVIAIQLFLIVYFGIPITDQLLNLAFSIYTNYDLLKNDTNIQQTLDSIIKQIQAYLPVDLAKLQSVDWNYYYRVLEMAYSLFLSAVSYRNNSSSKSVSR